MKKTVLLLVVTVLLCCSLRHTFAQDDVQDIDSINDINVWETERDEIVVDDAVVPWKEFVQIDRDNFAEPSIHLIKRREAGTDSGVETPPKQNENNQTDSKVNVTTPETPTTPYITTTVPANNTTNSSNANSTESIRQEEKTIGISKETTLESTTIAPNVSTSNLNETSPQNATDASITNETEVTPTPVNSTESTISTLNSQTESAIVSANAPESTINGTTPGHNNETSGEAHDEKKKGRKLPAALPKDLAEVKSEIKELEDKEVTDQKQSGNAIVYIKEGDSKTLLEGRDAEKAIANLEKKQELGELPNTGESSSDIKKGAAKDTTILIILFVAVLVVFALGFVYSWVKNRRQERHQKTLSENINSIRKSLQNLNTDKNEDIEAGTELKPLMKNSEQKPVAEYTDKDETDNARKDDDQKVTSENNVKIYN